MAKKDDNEIKIFKLNRIKFNELYQDAIKYIRATYQAVGQQFNTASPFGQLLQVVLHLGRMIFYYIEDSISGLNIRTAYRPDQVKGLAMLAGHDSSRPIAARGACQIYFVDSGNYQLNGQVCYIPNKTKVICKRNGLRYTILFGANNGKITMISNNFLEANLIQGEIKLQSATGTGEPLQSYNFAERNYHEVDQYYINVYVNGEPWEIHKSILDLGFNQKGCIVRTGINAGIDIFFGNGDMGAIPPEGSSIIVEYIVTAGEQSNLTMEETNIADNWEFDGEGMLPSGETIKLNGNFKIKLTTDIIFGTSGEDLGLTQLIAPHMSRSFVLASETNYQYFFKRMNMFSEIEVFRGSYTVNGESVMQLAKDKAEDDYNNAREAYKNAVSLYGEGADEVADAHKEMERTYQIYQYASTKLNDNTFQDNTIYIFLVPDIKKRMASSSNYFTCNEELFYLSKDEQENIINLINSSGQRIITVENRIIQPKKARFALNVRVKIWDNYDKQEVYSAAVDKLSEYFLNRTRKDMIPISDIISIFENDVPGVNSVKAEFVADAENTAIYGNDFDGIDEYGDIILTRTIKDANGQVMQISDIIPLIRGKFLDKNGQEYKQGLSDNPDSYDKYAFNLIVEDKKSSNLQRTLTKYTALT